MKIWFDTEFIEDGRTIDLISIGMIREDGVCYYAESSDCDLSRAGEWVQKNVLPHLTGSRRTRVEIRDDILQFCGQRPEFWAYYADYDWVALCQLFGTMMDLPHHWPMFCRDVKQLCVDKGNPPLPKDTGIAHNALSDAKWAKQAWEFLQ